MKKILMICLSVLITGIYSCKKDPPTPPENTDTGNICLKFGHHNNGTPLIIDSLMYVNAAGNEYMVNELQYFISDVVLVAENNSESLLDGFEDIHYVDNDLPSTMTWNVEDKIKTGNYKAIRFIFGITQAKNISYMYVNPPERDMFWPDALGGGYHYLKLNGKWKNLSDQVLPFDFHIGIGQIYAGGVIVLDSITGFVQNYFEVSLQDTVFSIYKDATTDVEIIMDVNSWFDTPNIWDHNVYGNYIMQNQGAMQKAKENGMNAFSYKVLN